MIDDKHMIIAMVTAATAATLSMVHCPTILWRRTHWGHHLHIAPECAMSIYKNIKKNPGRVQTLYSPPPGKGPLPSDLTPGGHFEMWIVLCIVYLRKLCSHPGGKLRGRHRVRCAILSFMAWKISNLQTYGADATETLLLCLLLLFMCCCCCCYEYW